MVKFAYNPNCCLEGAEIKPLLQPKRHREHWLYARLRDGADPHTVERREFFNSLWAKYAPFAPKGFKKKLQYEFHQRWWEMYLVVALLSLGFSPKKKSADTGPDVTLDAGAKLIVVEATAPSVGCASDRVPDPVPNGVADFPERECLLRLTQALTEKNKRFRKYVDADTVPQDACQIIALSVSDLNQFGSLLDDPLSVLAGFGPTVVTIGGKKPPYSSRRNTLTRDSGSPVDVALFEKPEFSLVSGVIYSPADLWNAPLDPGDTLALFLNPNAVIPVPMEFQERFVTWRRLTPEGNKVVWKKCQSGSRGD